MLNSIDMLVSTLLSAFGTWVSTDVCIYLFGAVIIAFIIRCLVSFFKF